MTRRKRAVVWLVVVLALMAAVCGGGWIVVGRVSRFADANAAFGAALDAELPGAVWTFVPRGGDAGWSLVVGLPADPDADAVRTAAATAWRLHAETRAEGSLRIGAVAVGRARRAPSAGVFEGPSVAWESNAESAASLVERTGVPAPPVDGALDWIWTSAAE